MPYDPDNIDIPHEGIMKKIIFTLALLLSPSAFAGVFDNHFYVSMDGGIEYSNNASGTTTAGISGTKFFGGLAAGYSFSLTPKFNLGANIFSNLINNAKGTHSNISVTTSNNLGFSLEPGYYLNDKILTYAKIGYTRMDAQLGDGIVKVTTTPSGYLVGAGFKYSLDETAFVGAEIVHYEYGDTTVQLSNSTIYKSDQNAGLITIGFQF